MSEGGERRLAAIMFTDMVGYTALGQKNESLSLVLVEEQRKLVRPILARHNGKEIKTWGDAFLAEFPNALDAVRCAYDIQRATREFNVSLPVENRIHLRVGLHLGDVVESSGDISGDAVNVASRIEPLAEDSGVCLTRQVYDHVSNKFELPLSSIGLKMLKNVNEPLEVFKMMMPWEKEIVEPPLQLESKRIAVLPFVSMSPDPNDEYFADGMTDEIISTVSRLEQVEVISRTSIMQYRKNPKPIREVSKELNVGTILEGSVRKAGNRLRITAQLVDATKDRHLWAETYERNMEDVFVVQIEVAEKVANALQVSLHKPDRGKLTGNIEAYTMYLRAMRLVQEYTESSCQEAITLFKAAISMDPTFSPAYAGLATAWIMIGAWSGWGDRTTSMIRAETAARKALELDPESAEAHSVMGSVHLAMDRFDEARLELERAIQINPNLASVNENLGWEYSCFGRLDEAIKYIQKACVLDPLNPKPVPVLINILRAQGKVDEALEKAGKLEQLYPMNPVGYLQTALCYLQKKDYAKASEALETGLRYSPDDYYLRVTRGMAFALWGRREDALSVLQRLMMDEAESSHVDGQLWIRTALGDYDAAFEALTRQAELHSWWYSIKFDPLFEGLQKDPRFAEFCKKVGLSH